VARGVGRNVGVGGIGEICGGGTRGVVGPSRRCTPLAQRLEARVMHSIRDITDYPSREFTMEDPDGKY
jgi:hypothetical protein